MTTRATTKAKTVKGDTTTATDAHAAVVVEVGKLALAGWVVSYVSGPFRLRTAPAEATDRGLRIETCAEKLHVALYLPLASKPGKDEPRAITGGLFDAADAEALAGLEWSREPCHIERKRSGLALTAPVLGPKPVTLREVKPESEREEFLFARPFGGLAYEFATLSEEPDDVREFTLDSFAAFRESALGTLPDGLKASVAGSLYAALAVVDRVSPGAVKLARYDETALVLSGQQGGFGFDIVVPFLPLPTVQP